MRTRSRTAWMMTMVLAGTLVTGGAAVVAQQRYPAATGAGRERVQWPAGQDRVSMPFRRSGEHILLPVSVNGAEPLWVVLDTGMPGPGILLYERPQLAALKLSYGDQRARVAGAGGTGQAIEARIARGATLGLGGAKLGDAMVTVLPAAAQFAPVHDGIIGMAVFQNFVATIDHDRGVVELIRPEAFTPPREAAEVPLTLEGAVAYVSVGLVGSTGSVAPLSLILDLGASHAVSLNRTTSPAIPVPAPALATRIGRGLSGPVLGQVGRIAGLEIGGRRLTNLVATFPDAAHEHPRGLDTRNGNLGSGVLGRFNVTFDYRGKRMFLAPNQRFSEPFEWDMSGLVLEPAKDGTLRVAEVVPESPASAAGIAAGDVVLAVEGAPVTSRDFSEVRERLRRDGAGIEMRVGHDRQERSVRLRLRRMV